MILDILFETRHRRMYHIGTISPPSMNSGFHGKANSAIHNIHCFVFKAGTAMRNTIQIMILWWRAQNIWLRCPSTDWAFLQCIPRWSLLKGQVDEADENDRTISRKISFHEINITSYTKIAFFRLLEHFSWTGSSLIYPLFHFRTFHRYCTTKKRSMQPLGLVHWPGYQNWSLDRRAT